jgi:hypothetical protein
LVHRSFANSTFSPALSIKRFSSRAPPLPLTAFFVTITGTALTANLLGSALAVRAEEPGAWLRLEVTSPGCQAR